MTIPGPYQYYQLGWYHRDYSSISRGAIIIIKIKIVPGLKRAAAALDVVFFS